MARIFRLMETTIRIGGHYSDFGYSDGLLPFTIHSDGGYIRGYVDKVGREAISFKGIEFGYPFIDGVAKVFLANGPVEPVYGYINTNGRFIWLPKTERP